MKSVFCSTDCWAKPTLLRVFSLNTRMLAFICSVVSQCLPSVLWRCWLGSRKGSWPVKILGGVVVGGGAVNPVGVAPTRTVGASASIIHKNPEELFLLVPAYLGGPEQRPLNGCCWLLVSQCQCTSESILCSCSRLK